MKTYGVIMAGGGGTRFWPLSRRELPKQFLNLTGNDILVNETFDRLNKVAEKEDIFVVTNAAHAAKTLDMMRGRVGRTQVLAEPAARNTAACIGYAAMEILKKYGDGIMCVMPSDHYVERENLYVDTVRRGVLLAEEKDCLVTIGITPTYPATGYGYIRSHAVRNEDGSLADYRMVEEFVEKPAEETAQAYLESGNFSWNSGMFIWKASLILDYFKRLLPDIYECLERIGDAMGTDREAQVLEEIYPYIPKISIDYGILERADRIIMLEGNFGWNDIGSLDALELLHEQDEHGNTPVGESVLVDTEGTICYAKDKLVVAAYVRDLMIVESRDAVLVCPREKAQDVKKIVELLKKESRDAYL